MIGTDGWVPGNRLNHIWAFDLATGAVRWKTPLMGGVVSDIVRAGSRIVAITRGDSLLCLDLAGGRRLWAFAADDSASEEGLLFRSPAVIDGRVYVGDMEGRVHALNVDSGRPLWSRRISSAISTSILAIGDELLVADTRGIAHRIDRATGEVRDTTRVGGVLLGTPVATRDSLVMLTGAQALSCLDLTTGRIRWTRSVPVSSRSPYLWNGDVLLGSKGDLVAFRASDGLLQWSRTFSGTIRCIGHDDRLLYLGTLEGVVSAYEPGFHGPVH